MILYCNINTYCYFQFDGHGASVFLASRNQSPILNMNIAVIAEIMLVNHLSVSSCFTDKCLQLGSCPQNMFISSLISADAKLSSISVSKNNQTNSRGSRVFQETCGKHRSNHFQILHKKLQYCSVRQK